MRAGAHAVPVVATALPWRSAASAAARMLRAYARAAVGERVASATTLILPRDAAAPVTCRAQRFSNNFVSPWCEWCRVTTKGAPPAPSPCVVGLPACPLPPVSAQPRRVATPRLCDLDARRGQYDRCTGGQEVGDAGA